jgi:hypothetical protein
MRMNHPRLDIDDLANVIRESMVQKNDDAPRRVAQTVSPPAGPPQLKLQPDFEPGSDHRYHINDLLRYHDRVFVQVAYRAVLKRSANDTELLRDLRQLRSGNVNKIDLLATLRFSPEGRAKGVQLDGLLLPALIRRLGQVPLLGYPIRLGIALVRLPNLIRDQREFGSYLLAQNEQMADFINGSLTERLTDGLNILANEQHILADDNTNHATRRRLREPHRHEFRRREAKHCCLTPRRNAAVKCVAPAHRRPSRSSTRAIVCGS